MLEKEVCKQCFKLESQPLFPKEEWFNGQITCPPGARIGKADVMSGPPEDCPHKEKHELQ